MQGVGEHLAGFVEIDGIVYREGRVEEREQEQSRQGHSGERSKKCVGGGLRMRFVKQTELYLYALRIGLMTVALALRYLACCAVVWDRRGIAAFVRGGFFRKSGKRAGAPGFA